MKYKVFCQFGLAVIIILFSSYSAGEREETFYYSKNHFLFQQDKCFAKFLSDLNSLEALVFIPEENITQAKSFDMVRYSGDKAKKKNMDFNKRSSSYVQIKPSKGTSSDCEKSIALNFNNLEMTVFVKKENVGKAQDLLQIKLEKGASLTSETMKINTKSAETLQIKVEGKSWQNYVPVAL